MITAWNILVNLDSMLADHMHHLQSLVPGVVLSATNNRHYHLKQKITMGTESIV